VPSETLPVGDVIQTKNYEFEVIETPGHSVGHIALVERSQGWCFSGDIFARENLKVIRPDEDMRETIKSMEKLISLDAERLILFTSVGKIIEKGREALAACIRYLEDLSGKSKEFRDQGYGIDGIVKEIFGGEHKFAEMTNGQYAIENLIRSVLKI